MKRQEDSRRHRPRHHSQTRLRGSCRADRAALLADRAVLETQLGVTDAGLRRVGRGKR
jgi:hypothetical protein